MLLNPPYQLNKHSLGDRNFRPLTFVHLHRLLVGYAEASFYQSPCNKNKHLSSHDIQYWFPPVFCTTCSATKALFQAVKGKRNFTTSCCLVCIRLINVNVLLMFTGGIIFKTPTLYSYHVCTYLSLYPAFTWQPQKSKNKNTLILFVSLQPF